jgi:hypothetical protein
LLCILYPIIDINEFLNNNNNNNKSLQAVSVFVEAFLLICILNPIIDIIVVLNNDNGNNNNNNTCELGQSLLKTFTCFVV